MACMEEDEGGDGSRLERLLRLVESSKCEQTSMEAAEQAGALAADLRCDQRDNVAERLAKMLGRKDWNVRISSARALGTLAAHVEHPLGPKESPERVQVGSEGGRLSLREIVPEQVVKAEPLLASGGEEFELPAPAEGETREERLRKAKRALKKRLGLEDMDALLAEGEGLDDIVEDRDLEAAHEMERGRGHKEQYEEPKMRVRKRKREQTGQSDNAIWPLDPVGDKLLNWLFHQRWQARHGSATALREMLSTSSGKFGVSAKQPAAEDNVAWHEDCCARLICLLGLDRFADFTGDTAIAPVREAASQALAISLKNLPDSSISLAASLLMSFVESAPSWETRQGALLGLKFALALQPHLLSSFNTKLFQTLSTAVCDESEDVVATACFVLEPVCETLCREFDCKRVRDLCGSLWERVRSPDPLDGATAPAISALSKILLFGPPETVAQDSVNGIVDSLCTLMQHPLVEVRRQASHCFCNLVGKEGAPSVGADTFLRALACLFQVVLLDEAPSSARDSSRAFCTTACYLLQKRTEIDPMGVFSWLVAVASVPATCAFNEQDIIQCWSSDEELRCRSVIGDKGTHASSCLLIPCHHHDLEKGTEERNQEGGGDDTGRARASSCISDYMKTVVVPLSRIEEALAFLKARLDDSSSADGVKAVCWALASFCDDINKPSNAFEISHNAFNGLYDTLQPMIEGGNSPQNGFSELEPMYRSIARDTCAFLRDNAVEPPQTLKEGVAKTTKEITEALNLVQGKRVNKERSLRDRIESLATLERSLQTQIAASASQALIALPKSLPDDIESCMTPLMHTLQRQGTAVQSQSAQTLAKLALMTKDSSPITSTNIVRHVCRLACADPSCSPPASSPEPDESDDHAFYLSLPSEQDESTREEKVVMREGAEMALREMAAQAGSKVFSQLPSLWESVAACLTVDDVDKDQATIDCARVLAVLTEIVQGEALDCVRDLAIGICTEHLSHEKHSVRSTVAVCVAAVARVDGVSEYSTQAFERVLDHIESSDNKRRRLGGISALSALLSALSFRDLSQYIYMALLPCVRRLSDPVRGIRAAASQCFAKMLTLSPLAQPLGSLPGLSERRAKRVDEDRRLLEQFLENSKLAHMSMPEQVRLKKELRPYQKQGIRWLDLLRRLGLHGALCDEMGLGKTLQALAIIAIDAHERRSCDLENFPSLVLCPSTLVGHWKHEAMTSFEQTCMRVLAYTGSPEQRRHTRARIPHEDVVITSYDIFRKEAEAFSKQHWAYCVLDEGHVIRNPKTKIAHAVKSLRAEHRLVLTGTPIHNGAEELWALFDFLMPGFLGSQKEFKAKHTKGRNKAEDVEALSLGRLHKQVIPFILRRKKEDVLAELPEKVVQDIYVHPSDLQLALHSLTGDIAQGQAHEKETEALLAVNFIKRLCTHPKLAAETHPDGLSLALEKAKSRCPQLELPIEDAERKAYISRLEQAPKLQAMKDLLSSAGIGSSTSGQQHKALIFAQARRMLDIVEEDVIGPFFDERSVVRIDGGVDANQRFQVARRFNEDPVVQVLLLTTQIGGQGLNLTSADTVIFLEHDWNPQRDLQAMDRAHRIGQRRSVTVYRLLTRNTLEERVMSLQRFKVNVAESIVNADNASVANVNPRDILDALTPAQPADEGGGDDSMSRFDLSGIGGLGGKEVQTAIERLEKGMVDPTSYEKEFSVHAFAESTWRLT